MFASATTAAMALSTPGAPAAGLVATRIAGHAGVLAVGGAVGGVAFGAGPLAGATSALTAGGVKLAGAGSELTSLGITASGEILAANATAAAAGALAETGSIASGIVLAKAGIDGATFIIGSAACAR